MQPNDTTRIQTMGALIEAMEGNRRVRVTLRQTSLVGVLTEVSRDGWFQLAPEITSLGVAILLEEDGWIVEVLQ